MLYKGIQPLLASRLQYFCLENLPSRQRSLAGHSLQGLKESDTSKAALHTQMQDCFCPWQLCQRELSMKAQLLGLQGPRRRQACRGRGCLQCRTYGPTRVFF